MKSNKNMIFLDSKAVSFRQLPQSQTDFDTLYDCLISEQSPLENFDNFFSDTLKRFYDAGQAAGYIKGMQDRREQQAKHDVININTDLKA